jgi:uncharacterized membrane protein YidH (DUF202 family)
VRKPFIVGRTADKVLGFFIGVFGLIVGVLATIAVAYLWAGSSPDSETQARRAHAAAISISAAIGCVTFILVIVALLEQSSSSGW